jgi:death-on-curing protein
MEASHGFADGNKRVGHAAMEAFLLLNGWKITCGVNEQERVILEVASGAEKHNICSSNSVR